MKSLLNKKTLKLERVSDDEAFQKVDRDRTHSYLSKSEYRKRKVTEESV
jgi:hypothetical protein